MRTMIKILLLLLLPVLSKAQQNPYWQEPNKEQADSFRIQLQHENNDTSRMYLCRELGSYYRERNRDSSLYFFQQQLLIAQILKLKLWAAEAYNGIGLALMNLGDYPKSLEALLNAQTITQDIESEKNIWRISTFSKTKNPHIVRLTELATNYDFFGILYGRTGDMKKRLYNYFECRKISESIHDSVLLAGINMVLGETYISLDKLDSALDFEHQALQYSNESGYKTYKGFILYIIGNIYLQNGNYDSTNKYYNESIQINKEQQNLFFLGNAYVLKANLFLSIGKTDSSLFFAKEGLQIYQEIVSPEGMLRAYASLSSIYKARKNIDSAFLYQGLAMVAKDSLDNAEKIKLFQDIGFDQQLKVQELEKEKIETQNKIRTYTLLSGLVVILLIVVILYRNNKQKQNANRVLESTLLNLKSTQSQLIQSEKMASLGELTVGIAHEIQNPLNFINNFSEVNIELIDEMEQEIKVGNSNSNLIVAENIKENNLKIIHHGKRADGIVKSMLQHSQASSGVKQPTDINNLAEEYLHLSYQGLRAKDKLFNAKIESNLDPRIGKINIVSQNIGRVLLNLINNAFYSVSERQKQGIQGYEPKVVLTTRRLNNKVEILIKDNGMGIPPRVRDKIFQPFFTTKPTGQGTGLGLSLSNDIIRAQGGTIQVTSLENEMAEFRIELPL